MSQEFVPQILSIDEIGQKLYGNQVTQRINGSTTLWAHVKRENKMYTTGSRKQTVKVRDKVTDLKETKNSYGRLMGSARSSRDVHMKQAVGNYGFTPPPPGHTLHQVVHYYHALTSSLIHAFQQLTSDQSSEDDPHPASMQVSHRSPDGDGIVKASLHEPTQKAAIIDGG